MTYTKKITKQITAFALTLSAAASVALGGGLDNNPKNAGETQSRPSGGTVFDGATGNPALVGLDTPPRGGLSLAPFSVTLWSDKLSPPLELNTLIFPLISGDTEALRRAEIKYITKLIRKSFDIEDGLSDPDKVSDRITERLRGGIGVYAGAKISPIVFATRGFGLSVSTFADADVRIPGGLLTPFFSETEGLLANQSADLSDMRVRAVSATEIAVKLGYLKPVPFFRDYLGLDTSAFGVGIKMLFGHAYFDAKMMEGGNISYDANTNKYNVNARMTVTSVGTGLYDNFKYKDGYLISNPINGQGWGFDFGTIFHNNSHAVSIDVQNVGLIIWDGKAVYKDTVSFEPYPAFKNGFDLNDLRFGTDSLFKDPDRALNPSNRNEFMPLPASLNLGYTYTLRLHGGPSALLGYMTANLGFKQQLVLSTGNDTYMPRLSAGATFGLLAGCLPVRYGLAYGGPEKLVSAVGVGMNLRHLSIDAFYKAVGSPVLLPDRGFELGYGMTFAWGWRKKRIKDAPPPPAPADTAPEPVIPTAPESFPADEPPADTSEIYDPVAEINLTMLPAMPPETPPPPPEPLPQPTEDETQTLAVSQRAINFMTGNATLTEDSYAPLNAIADLLIQYPHIRYEVQGHTDSQGPEVLNLLLSAERAAVVKYYLITRGAPESSLVAVGYGKNIPIADNNTVIGRALNRRVEFVQIMSQTHYDWVKRFELEMIPKLTNRVIDGKPITEPKNSE